AVVIDPDGHSADDFLRTFERVRQILLDRYGRPSAFLEEGDPGSDVAAAVNGGGFIRISEWSRADGVLRFGIPRRLDGQVRIEIQFAQDFPSLRDTLWSIQEVK